MDLYHGDCLAVLPTLPAQSVDAVICDPPYGTTACKWDSVIPFVPMWAELKRVVKPRGAVVLFGSQPFTSALVMSNPKWFRYELVWEKSAPTGHLDAARKPLRSHENILVFGATTPAYAPQKWRVDPRFIDRRKAFTVLPINSAAYGAQEPQPRIDDDGTRFPLSIISVPSLGKDSEHDTQKPVALMEYLIRTYTSEGDTVLDFTMGSGTTGVGCVNTGRRFIGIEQDAGYFKIAQQRIAAAQAAPVQLELAS
jgi:site-specific DNA-methyltransferase (adenine-specific)